MLIYLVMSLGLAYNDRPPAHPEELLHRPLFGLGLLLYRGHLVWM